MCKHLCSNLFDAVSIGLFQRQYEEKQLKAQQERAQRRLEFSNQESRLMNQVRK